MSKALPLSITGPIQLANNDSSGKEYYYTQNTLKSPQDFSQVIYYQRPGGFAPVLKTLMPEGLELGSTRQAVLDKLGKPNFTISNEHQVAGHEVVFYRRELSPFLVCMQFHLFRGRLVYAQSRFIEEGEASGTLHEVLLHNIRRNVGVEKGEQAFQDGDGNRLWVEEGETLVLHYLSGDSVLKSAFPRPAKFRYQRPGVRTHLGWLRDSA